MDFYEWRRVKEKSALPKIEVGGMASSLVIILQSDMFMHEIYLCKLYESSARTA